MKNSITIRIDISDKERIDEMYPNTKSIRLKTKQLIKNLEELIYDKKK